MVSDGRKGDHAGGRGQISRLHLGIESAWRVRWSSFLLVLGVLACVQPAAALDPSRAITQYVHDTWTAKDGAPAGTITGITQGDNGYLWLGTEGEGLVRFDGMTFVREPGLDALFGRRGDRVTSLIRARDGALWIGTTRGLARSRSGA
jgi:ligand-binding sensor domain-containing protein